MLTKWLNENSLYDGSQMTPLKNYLDHGLLGDSVISWVGRCLIEPDQMLDGEDLRERSVIAGDLMLHFVFELFDVPLITGVLWQRLFADLVRAEITREWTGEGDLIRSGDDLYFQNQKKLSISIAAPSRNSVLVHFAVNVTNQGTPVKTAALKDDFGLDPKVIATQLLQKAQEEWESVKEASWKVRGV